MLPTEKLEEIKNKLRDAARKEKYLNSEAAFYWLAGEAPNMTIAEAVKIVDELRQEPDDVFHSWRIL